MHNLIELDHEHNKWELGLILASIKEKKYGEMLAIVKEEVKIKSQFGTNYLIETRRLGNILDNN